MLLAVLVLVRSAIILQLYPASGGVCDWTGESAASIVVGLAESDKLESSLFAYVATPKDTKDFG
jgi:hypothetical protein